MIYFYRCFLRDAAAIQALLHAVLSSPKVKGSHPVIQTPELQAFEDCKASLSHATLLAHPDSSAPLALVTDTSNSAIGAVLQQRKHDSWQPFAFFSKKLSSQEQNIVLTTGNS